MEMYRRHRHTRMLVMRLHGLYAVALLGAAIGVLMFSFRDPTSDGADWAVFDRVFGPVIAAGIGLLAVTHALVAVAWFGGAPTRWVLATTIPVVALLVWVWAGGQSAGLPSWEVAVAAVLAALSSVLAAGPLSSHATGANGGP